MARVTGEPSVIAQQPEPRRSWGWGSYALHIKSFVARNDHHAPDRWHAAKPREAVRPCWEDKEPVPREEGRLQGTFDNIGDPDSSGSFSHSVALCL